MHPHRSWEARGDGRRLPSPQRTRPPPRGHSPPRPGGRAGGAHGHPGPHYGGTYGSGYGSRRGDGDGGSYVPRGAYGAAYDPFGPEGEGEEVHDNFVVDRAFYDSGSKRRYVKSAYTQPSLPAPSVTSQSFRWSFGPNYYGAENHLPYTSWGEGDQRYNGYGGYDGYPDGYGRGYPTGGGYSLPVDRSFYEDQLGPAQRYDYPNGYSIGHPSAVAYMDAPPGVAVGYGRPTTRAQELRAQHTHAREIAAGRHYV